MTNDYVEKILSTVEEAKIHKYPEFVLKYDLQKVIDDIVDEVSNIYKDDYDNGYESGYEEAKDEFFEDAYDDGKSEGIAEAREKFIKTLAAKMIQIKRDIQLNSLTDKDLQKELTKLVVDMDEDDLLWGEEEQILKNFDA